MEAGLALIEEVADSAAGWAGVTLGVADPRGEARVALVANPLVVGLVVVLCLAVRDVFGAGTQANHCN